MFLLFFVGIAVYDINCLSSLDKPAIEFIVQGLVYKYSLYVLMITSSVSVLWSLRAKALPRLLARQAFLLISLVVIPYWLSNFVQLIFISFAPGWANTSYFLVNIDNILLMIAAYYCSRKIIGLRFLNLSNHVSAPVNYNLLQGFSSVTGQLNKVNSLDELEHIAKAFFREALGVPAEEINFYTRYTAQSPEKKTRTSPVMPPVRAVVTENFIKNVTKEVYKYIGDSKALIYDEIVFDNFYQKTACSESILKFLDSINVEVFVPIFEKEKMIGYITIERGACNKKFYD